MNALLPISGPPSPLHVGSLPPDSQHPDWSVDHPPRPNLAISDIMLRILSLKLSAMLIGCVEAVLKHSWTQGALRSARLECKLEEVGTHRGNRRLV